MTFRLHFAVLLAAFPLAAIAQGTEPATQTHGIVLSDIDTSTKPGDNFYMYANGLWQQRTVIPPDRVSVGSFTLVFKHTNEQLQAIFADATKANAAPDTDTGRIANLYASYMNEAAIEQHGMPELKAHLAEITAIQNQHDLAHALGLTLRADVDALNATNFHTANLFGLWVAPGFNDPTHYAPYLLQGGDMLPSRDYYLSDSEKMQQLRQQYIQHIARMFTLAGFDNPMVRATHVFFLERALANGQISLADSEDIHKADNVWQASDFNTRAPGLDWPTYFAAAGLGNQKSFYVWQPTAFTAEAAVVASQPLDAWKDWLAYHLIESYAGSVSKQMADERFAFFGTALSGAPQQQPRPERAIGLVNGVLGDAVGQLYVQHYFSPEAKARAQAMVAGLLVAYHHRLEAIDWMAPSTKAEAIKKLDSLRVGIGYPDHWRSYTGLTIAPDDLFGNLYRASLFDYRYNLGRIDQPVDRGEWCMDPQTVNAVNLPLDNGLNFPAAILQPPFFDPQAPDADNYGAIGAVIGHEISHTFDAEGSTFDSHGQVRDWWTPADLAHFKQVTGALAAQFDTYEPFPGVHVNGQQTIDEDIADLGGVAASLDAFHASLHGQPAPKVGGYNGDQQFFLAFAQIWRTKTREAAARQGLLTDPHAPGQYRAETVRNFDAWYKAFNVQPGQKLYLAPDQRVHIW
jgi:endothelin-converting enzyme/putative endopeptidase